MPSFEYMCMRWLIDMCISLIPVMLVFGFKAWFHISNIVFNAIPVFPEGVIVFGDGAFPQGLDAYMAEYTVFMLFMCAALRGFPARPVLAMIVLCLTIFIWCFIGRSAPILLISMPREQWQRDSSRELRALGCF